MSLLTLGNERRFNRDLRVLLPGGMAGGLMAAVMALVAGQHHHGLMALGFGGALGLVAALSDLEDHTPAVRAVLALLGGAIAAVAFPNPIFAALIGGAAMGLALSLEEDTKEQILSTLSFGAALAAGVYTTGTLFGEQLMGALDVPFVREVVTGGIWGAFMTVGAGAKELRWDRDVRRLRLMATAEEVGSAERGYINAADDLYGEIRSEVDEVPDPVAAKAERILGQTVEALQSLCRRSSELRVALRSHPKSMLQERLGDVDNRLEHCRDSSVAAELRAARQELAEQLQIRDHLQTAIVRLEVRQQRCVNALERLHIQLVRTGGTEAAELSMDATIDELDRLAEDVEWQETSVDTIVDETREKFDELDLSFEEMDRSEPVMFQDLEVQAEVDTPADGADRDAQRDADGVDARVGRAVESFKVSSGS